MRFSLVAAALFTAVTAHSLAEPIVKRVDSSHTLSKRANHTCGKATLTLDFKAAVIDAKKIRLSVKAIKSNDAHKKAELQRALKKLIRVVTKLDAEVKQCSAVARRSLNARLVADPLAQAVFQLLVVVADIVVTVEGKAGSLLPGLSPLFLQLNTLLGGLLAAVGNLVAGVLALVAELLIALGSRRILSGPLAPLLNGVGDLLFGVGVTLDQILSGGFVPPV